MLRSWRNVVIFGFILVVVFLLVGGGIYYYDQYPPDVEGCLWLWMSLQNCMESLLSNPLLPTQDIAGDTGFMDSIGLGQKIVVHAYSVVMVLAPLFEVLVAFSIFDHFLHFFVDFGLHKRHILIVGYNDTVRSLIKNRCRNGKVYLWTESFLSGEEERELYDRKVSVKMNDFSLGDSPEEDVYLRQKQRFNQFIKKKKITDVLLLDSSDVKNIQYYMTLSSCDICRERTIHFSVLTESFEARNMLQDYFDNYRESLPLGATEDTHLDLRIFNLNQIQAEILLEQLPVYEGIRKNQAESVHMLLVGGNLLCLQIALQAMNQAVFSPSNIIVIDILNDSIAELENCFKKRFHPEFVQQNENEYEIKAEKADGMLKIRLFTCNIMEEDICSRLTELQDSAAGVYTYIALCSKKVDENLHVFRCIEKHSGITEQAGLSNLRIPVAMRMTYSKEMMERLPSFEWCKLYLFGEDGEYIGIDQVINLEEEEYIRAYHEVYESVSHAHIEGKENVEDKDLMWNRLDYFKRESNRALYYHKAIKELLFQGQEYEEEMQQFWKMKVPDDNIIDKASFWSENLLREEEGKYLYPKLLKMARTEHRRWVYFQASEGWGYSKKKKPEERLHDCLCNWDTLVKTKKNTLIYDLISSPVLMKWNSSIPRERSVVRRWLRSKHSR